MKPTQEQLDIEAHPFFFIFWVCVALFVAEAVYDDYRSKQDHAAMSQMVAECANGKTVPFGRDAVMKCQVLTMVAINE